jgi:hypothetical protein
LRVRKIFRILFLFALAFASGFTPMRGQQRACECPPSELSEQETEKYTVIFRGTIDSVKTCDDTPGRAYFRVDELYKGRVQPTFVVAFWCGEACAVGFHPGEEWLIYTNHQQVYSGRMDWCSRSRKYFRNVNEDYYAVNYGVSYFDELAFLRKHLGIHRTMDASGLEPAGRNFRPSTFETVVLLVCSLAGILLFYWLFRKLFK